MEPALILYLLQGYFALGLLVAVGFVTVGVARVDGAAKGSSIAFRILILPGCAALWPLVLRRWITAPRGAST